MFYGFIIIFLAWLWQWNAFSRKGLRSIDPWFLRLSAIGFLIITLDTFRLSDWLTWFAPATLAIVLYFVWRHRH